eukprot:760514-Hanusia_phi.AAC.1
MKTFSPILHQTGQPLPHPPSSSSSSSLLLLHMYTYIHSGMGAKLSEYCRESRHGIPCHPVSGSASRRPVPSGASGSNPAWPSAARGWCLST